MRKRSKALIVVVVLVLLVIAPWPPAYLQKRQTITVIDSVTKEPVVGAMVIVNWRVDGWVSFSNRSLRVPGVRLMTNKEGQFVIPFKVIWRRWFSFFDSLGPSQPMIEVMREYYYSNFFLNPDRFKGEGAFMLVEYSSTSNDKVVLELEPVDYYREGEYVRFSENKIMRRWMLENCIETQEGIERDLLIMADKTELQFLKRGIISQDWLGDDDTCESTKKWLLLQRDMQLGVGEG